MMCWQRSRFLGEKKTALVLFMMSRIDDLPVDAIIDDRRHVQQDASFDESVVA
jgi:hypothetical protein